MHNLLDLLPLIAVLHGATLLQSGDEVLAVVRQSQIVQLAANLGIATR